MFYEYRFFFYDETGFPLGCIDWQVNLESEPDRCFELAIKDILKAHPDLANYANCQPVPISSSS